MAMVGLPPVLGDTMEQGIFGCKRRNVTLHSSLISSLYLTTMLFVYLCSMCAGEDLRLTLRSKNIVVQRCVAVPGDRLYLRISCAVYNHWSEYETLRDVVLQLAAKAERLIIA
jgi:hypothetical protein